MSRTLKRYWRGSKLVKLPVKDFTRDWVRRCRQCWNRQQVKAMRREPIETDQEETP